jgi:hypothetical protein
MFRIMIKSRCKSDIRAAAQASHAKLRAAEEARTALVQPRHKSWHDVFLAQILAGSSASAAAKAAGVSKAGVYRARQHHHRFRAAWDGAYAEARAVKIRAARAAFSRSWLAQLMSFGSTIDVNVSTQINDIGTLSHSSHKSGQFRAQPPMISRLGRTTS